MLKTHVVFLEQQAWKDYLTPSNKNDWAPGIEPDSNHYWGMYDGTSPPHWKIPLDCPDNLFNEILKEKKDYNGDPMSVKPLMTKIAAFIDKLIEEGELTFEEALRL